MRVSSKLLICLGIGAALGGFIAFWRYASTPTTQPVGRVNSRSAADQALSDSPSAPQPPARAGGVMDQSATPWRLVRPAADARDGSAELRRAARAMETACQQAVGRWQISPASAIVLEPFGKVSRASEEGLSADPDSSWSCTQSHDVLLDLTEGRFTGRVNDAGQLEVTDLAGTMVVWPHSGVTDGN